MTLGPQITDSTALSADEWAEILIVPSVAFATAGETGVVTSVAMGEKCERCWKVLPEVSRQAGSQGLCLRCDDVIQSGMRYRPEAA